MTETKHKKLSAEKQHSNAMAVQAAQVWGISK